MSTLRKLMAPAASYKKQDLRKTRLSRSHPVIKALPGDLEDNLTNSFIDKNSDTGSDRSDVKSVMIENDIDYEEDGRRGRLYRGTNYEIDQFQALSMSFYEKKVMNACLDKRSVDPLSMGSRLSPTSVLAGKKHEFGSPEKKFVNVNSVYLRKPIQIKLTENSSFLEKNSLFSILENNNKKAMLSPKVQQKGLLKTERSSALNLKSNPEKERKQASKKREEKTTSEENRHIIFKLETKLKKGSSREKGSVKTQRDSNDTARDIRKEKTGGANMIVSIDIERVSSSMRDNSWRKKGNNEGDLSMRSPNGTYGSPTARISLRKNMVGYGNGNGQSKKNLKVENEVREKENQIPTKLVELKKTVLLKNISQTSTQNTTTAGSIVVKENNSLFESFDPKASNLSSNLGSGTKRGISNTEKNETKERKSDEESGNKAIKKNNQVVCKLPFHKLQSTMSRYSGMSSTASFRNTSGYNTQLTSSRSEREGVLALSKIQERNNRDNQVLFTEPDSSHGMTSPKQYESNRDRVYGMKFGLSKGERLNTQENDENERSTPGLFKAPTKVKQQWVVTSRDKDQRKCQDMKENKQEYNLCSNCGNCIKNRNNNTQGKQKTFRLE